MDVRITNQQGFLLLTDRWGNPSADAAGWPNADTDEPAAIARLLPKMFDEMSFVARRLIDGEVGILVEGAEMSHAESDDEDHEVASEWDGQTIGGRVVEDGHVPSLGDVIGEAKALAVATAETYPDLDVEVAHGPEVCMCRVQARAFVPESSPYIDDIQGIALSLTGQEPSPSPAP